MPFVIVLAVSAVTLSLINLLLTYGIVQRLRIHADLFRTIAGNDQASLAGQPIGTFTAVSTKGTKFSQDSLRGRMLVGFFAPDCTACHARLPEFIASARAGVADDAIAVVITDTKAGDMAAALESSATVFLETPQGPLSRAFTVRATPAFFVVEGTRIVATELPPLIEELAS